MVDQKGNRETARVWLKHYDHGVPPRLAYPGEPLFAFLDRAAAHNGAETALIYRDTALTYEQLLELVDRFARALAELGLEQGDRIALRLPTSPQFIIAYYASLKVGAVAVPLNPAFVARETLYCLQDSGAKILITAEPDGAFLARIREEAKPAAIIICKKDPEGLLPVRPASRSAGGRTKLPSPAEGTAVYPMEELTARQGTLPPLRLSAADPAVIMYTGSPRGTPLGAVLTHGNLAANVLQCRHWNPALEEKGREAILVALPLSHSYGMTVGMNLGLAIAGRLILLPRFSPGKALDLIHQQRATYFPGVPSMFEAILRSPDLRKYNLHSIKTCLSGGAPLPLAVQQEFEEVTGGRLMEGYGLAEASPVTHSNPYRGRRRAGSIGLPLPDTDMKIVDLQDENRTLPPGAVGELCVKGPQVMQGYYNAPEETARVLKDGWLHTGDIVHVDEDGFTYIVDRKKDLIISGGYNVYPGEVEAVLQSHPQVEKAFVSALRDPYKGEALQAVIVPRAGAAVTEEDIREYCRENLAAYKIPREIQIRTVSG